MLTEYAAWLRIVRAISRAQPMIYEGFRRMGFNVVGVNCDDHTKNQSFLMDRHRQWSLAPTYDLAYAWSPSPDHWTHQHQMTVNGKAWGITRADLHAVGAAVDIRPSQADQLIDQVLSAVNSWLEFAEQAGMNEQDSRVIGEHQQDAITTLLA